jgi:hypothetical protein
VNYIALSNKSIQEFKDIFKKEFSKDLTDAEAKEQDKRLLLFFKTLIGIDQREKNKSRS